MATIPELKSGIINLEQALNKTNIREFREDILACLKWNRARLRLLEGQAEIQGVPLWTEK